MEKSFDEKENLLEVKDLRMHFFAGKTGLFGGEKKYTYAVDGVSFEVKKGETLGLVGESGCGKSTVIRAVSQLYKPTSGNVIFEGKELTQMNNRNLLEARKLRLFI